MSEPYSAFPLGLATLRRRSQHVARQVDAAEPAGITER